MDEKIKLLILDDERDIIELMHDMLVDDFDVSISSDPEEAIELLSKESFNVLLSDLSMPKMNAFQVIEELHSRGVFIPTILMSGYSEKELSPPKVVEKYIIKIVEKPIPNLLDLIELISSCQKRTA